MSGIGRIISIVAGLALTVAISGHSASAASVATAPSPVFETVAGLTSVPVGHAEFCAIHKHECGPNTHIVDTVTLTQALWQQLLDVNNAVNTRVQPVTDEVLYKVAEYWTYPHGYGDCEDYALEKRRELIALGWPASTLLMTVVRQQNGEGHAVLTVRTDRGDLILDNQEGLVRPWDDTPYRYLKRQSQTNSADWVTIVDNRAATVIATR